MVSAALMMRLELRAIVVANDRKRYRSVERSYYLNLYWYITVQENKVNIIVAGPC